MVEFSSIEPTLSSLDELNVDILLASVSRRRRPLTGVASTIDFRLCREISAALRTDFYGGEKGEALLLPTNHKFPFPWVMLAGLGADIDEDGERWAKNNFRFVLRNLLERASKIGASRIAIEIPGRAWSAISASEATKALLSMTSSFDALVVIEESSEIEAVSAVWRNERRKRASLIPGGM